MTAFSFTNLAMTATISGSTTFLDSTWPATNVQLFGRPHLRAYSANLSAQRLTLDFGSATALTAIALINPNFLTVTIQGHSTDSWGSPGFTSGALTMGYAGNDRVHHIYKPTTPAFNHRFLSLSIPNQATTDGATVFKLGPIWAGVLVVPPRAVRVGTDETKEKAIQDTKTQDGRVIDRLKLDDPRWRVQAKFMAQNDAELEAWRAIFRQWDAAEGEAALVQWINTQANHTYLMRIDGAIGWPNDAVWSETTIDALEVTAG